MDGLLHDWHLDHHPEYLSCRWSVTPNLFVISKSNKSNLTFLAEFASISFTPGQNPSGYLVTKEWPFYVFDAVPIIVRFLLTGEMRAHSYISQLSAVVLAWYHPGGFLPAKKGLRIDGTFEETKAGRKYWCCGPRKSVRIIRGCRILLTSGSRERTAYAGGDVPMQAR